MQPPLGHGSPRRYAAAPSISSKENLPPKPLKVCPRKASVPWRYCASRLSSTCSAANAAVCVITYHVCEHALTYAI